MMKRGDLAASEPRTLPSPGHPVDCQEMARPEGTEQRIGMWHMRRIYIDVFVRKLTLLIKFIWMVRYETGRCCGGRW